MEKRVSKNRGACRNREADQQCDLETAKEIIPGSCDQDGCREDDLEVAEELSPGERQRDDQDSTGER